MTEYMANNSSSSPSPKTPRPSQGTPTEEVVETEPAEATAEKAASSAKETPPTPNADRPALELTRRSDGIALFSAAERALDVEGGAAEGALATLARALSTLRYRSGEIALSESRAPSIAGTFISLFNPTAAMRLDTACHRSVRCARLMTAMGRSRPTA